MCDGCRVVEDIDAKNIQEYSNNGYSILWDITDGLSDIVLCKGCAEKIRKSIREIESILNRNIDDINFTGF